MEGLSLSKTAFLLLLGKVTLVVKLKVGAVIVVDGHSVVEIDGGALDLNG